MGFAVPVNHRVKMKAKRQSYFIDLARELKKKKKKKKKEAEHEGDGDPIYPTPPLGQDMTKGQFFKRSLAGFNSEFSFSY